MAYFYILKCKDGSLYCGSAKDLEARVKKHNSGKGSAYVRSRGGGKVVYFEKFRKWGKALSREAEVKKWKRESKLELIKATTRLSPVKKSKT
jgi:predicted GIY-YIG superfamily endonuclease